jgi:hypothetical protein
MTEHKAILRSQTLDGPRAGCRDCQWHQPPGAALVRDRAKEHVAKTGHEVRVWYTNSSIYVPAEGDA